MFVSLPIRRGAGGDVYGSGNGGGGDIDSSSGDDGRGVIGFKKNNIEMTGCSAVVTVVVIARERLMIVRGREGWW